MGVIKSRLVVRIKGINTHQTLRTHVNIAHINLSINVNHEKQKQNKQQLICGQTKRNVGTEKSGADDKTEFIRPLLSPLGSVFYLSEVVWESGGEERGSPNWFCRC